MERPTQKKTERKEKSSFFTNAKKMADATPMPFLLRRWGRLQPLHSTRLAYRKNAFSLSPSYSFSYH